MTRSWRRSTLLAAGLLPVALHVGVLTARLLVPELHVVIDVREGKATPLGMLYTNNGTSLRFHQTPGGRMAAAIPRTRERPAISRLTFRWDAEARRVSEVRLNGIPLPARRVVTLRDELPDKTPFDLVVIRIRRLDQLRSIASAMASVCVWGGLLALLNPVLARRQRAGLSFLSLLTYSNAYAKHVPPRAVGLGMLVAAGTVFFYCGVDAPAIYDALRMSAAGLDVYQFQVSFRAITHTEFPAFPYNPLMLAFWTFFDRAWGPLFGRAPLIAGQMYLQLLLFKLVNAGLLVLTILSLVSFADEEELLAGSARWVFYLALFSPVLWYVAVLYVQLDTVPLYFVTLGVAMSHRFDRHGLVGPLFLAVGCAMKMQTLLLFPTAIVTFVYCALTSSDSLMGRLRVLGLGLLTVAIVCLVFLALNLRTGEPLQLLLSTFPSMERIWINIFPYTAHEIVYLTTASVLMVLLFYVFSLRLGLGSHAVISASILTSGSVISTFCAMHLYTPSTLLQIGSALTLLMLLEPDTLRRIAYSGATVLIVLTWQAGAVGDITRLWPGYAGFFTRLLPTLPPSATTRWVSFFFTLSVTSLLAYGVLFWSRARRSLCETTSDRRRQTCGARHESGGGDLEHRAAGWQ